MQRHSETPSVPARNPDMKEHIKWLWMARAVFVLATMSVFAQVEEIRSCTAYVITAIMYATSAILKSREEV